MDAGALSRIDLVRLENDIKSHFKRVTTGTHSFSGFANIATDSLWLSMDDYQIYGNQFRVPFIYSADLTSDMTDDIIRTFKEDTGLQMAFSYKYAFFPQGNSSRAIRDSNTTLTFDIRELYLTYGKNQSNPLGFSTTLDEYPHPMTRSRMRQYRLLDPYTDFFGTDEEEEGEAVEDGDAAAVDDGVVSKQRRRGCCHMFCCYRTYTDPGCTYRWFITSLVFDCVMCGIIWMTMAPYW